MTKHVLKGLSGYALPGETLYIMGQSGSGKTSLLNVLSDRINTNSSHIVSGKPLINHKIPCSAHVFGKIGAYVMQDDVLFTYFSPRQALRFAARLKLSIPFDKQDRKVE